ncbi:hypothetical protein [Parafrankia discariae]|uniref:hypothetical protein n=1 Tax=Parafrankia discariae TaxID=365528 RepID=UPI00039A2C64|nr:hypothetical protein [Parafrankia discariae]
MGAVAGPRIARELPGSDGSLAAADTTMIEQTFGTWCRGRTVQGVLLDPTGHARRCHPGAPLSRSRGR